MGNELFRFIPDQESDWATLWVCIILAVIGLVATVYFNKRAPKGMDPRYKPVIALLAFIVFLLGATTAFFSAWSLKKTTPVVLYEQGIVTPYGDVSYRDIRQAYIEIDRKTSLNPNQEGVLQAYLLIIEEKNGKSHVISSIQYPVQEILGRIKEAKKEL